MSPTTGLYMIVPHLSDNWTGSQRSTDGRAHQRGRGQLLHLNSYLFVNIVNITLPAVPINMSGFSSPLLLLCNFIVKRAQGM